MVHRALGERWAVLDLFPPMTKGIAATTVFLCTGLLRFLLSPKTQTMSLTKPHFPLTTPDRCLHLLFLPRGRSPPGGGWFFRVVTGPLTCCWALCPRRAEPAQGWFLTRSPLLDTEGMPDCDAHADAPSPGGGGGQEGDRVALERERERERERGRGPALHGSQGCMMACGLKGQSAACRSYGVLRTAQFCEDVTES